MSATNKKLPAEWEVIDDIAVIDPDGWDRRNFKESWNTPIDRNEWNRRVWMSTCARPLRMWKSAPLIDGTGIEEGE